MATIIFSDGTEVQTDFFVCNYGRVHFTLYGLTFIQAATLLSDSSKTGTLTVRGANNYQQTFTGYTNPAALVHQGTHLKAILEEVQ